jgi:predicted outer membrane repeat protein
MTVTRAMTRAAASAVAVVGVVLATAPAYGNAALTASTRYVAPSGHDGTNTCTVKSAPCKTIAHALSVAASGDTVSLASGTYAEHGLTVALPVTIAGSGPAKAIINGAQAGSSVFTVSDGASLVLSGVTVENGKTSDHGGAIVNSGTLTLTNDRFAGNSATDPGGAITNYAAITSITACRFVNNTSGSNGGAIESFGSIGPITDSLFVNNLGEAFGAGAVDNQGTITSIDDSIFVKNRSASGAGAVSNSDSIGDMSGDTFAHNESLGGIAGAFENIQSTLTTLTNDTFADNVADGDTAEGGAILNDFATIGTMADVTLTGNSAAIGGGLDNENGFINSVSDTIFSGNTAPQGANCYFFNSFQGAFVDAGHNLLGDTQNTCGFSTAKHDLINTDADLAPLGHYAGATLTTPPNPGSPVIDTGGAAPCPTAVDEVGTPRPQGAACDIGAVEYVPPAP